MTNLVKIPHDAVGPEVNFNGYEADDSTGEKLGSIDDVLATEDQMRPVYFVVDTGGWFHFGDKFVVPVGEVKQIDDNNKTVYFKTLTKQALERGTYPRYDESWWDQNDRESFDLHERQLAGTYRGGRPVNQVDYNSDLYRRPAQGAQRLQLLEEHLNVNKERVQAGVVHLGKQFTERTETVNVPVREDRVVIERTPVTGARAADGGRAIREGETVDVPVMKERVNVNKEVAVAEEVNVRTEAVERTQRVQDTVKREELKVDSDGNGTAQVVDQRGATPVPAGTRPNEPRRPA